MTVTTRIVHAAALAAAMALPISAPVTAGEKPANASEDIIVRSQSAMQEWQKQTTKSLNHALAREPVTRKVHPNNSVVEVTFTLGADGKAQNIELAGGNGNWAARRAAKYAVRTLDTLDDVPVVNPDGARFLASIIFANNPKQYRQLAGKVTEMRNARFASLDEEDRPILLGG